jgi:hypothetical protein
MRRRLIVSVCLVLALLVGVTIYRKWAPPLPPASQNGLTSPSSSPPFATKEPERYQAKRITSFSESTGEGNPLHETLRTTVLIFRDGNQRREEYETVAAGPVAYLETLTGRFVLLPQEKLYADLNETSSDAKLSELQTDSQSIHSNYLLHESNFAPRYEKLGNETIDGRVTLKYRVTASLSTNATTVSERVIWVDEVLGLPVKTELVHREGVRSSNILMQLTEIRTEVDLTQFEIPSDYRKVNPSQIFALVASTGETIRGPKLQK